MISPSRGSFDFDSQLSRVAVFGLWLQRFTVLNSCSGGLSSCTMDRVARFRPGLSPFSKDRISDHDIIGYTAEAQNFTHGQFSSNFLAGKKGSVVMGAIWKAQKEFPGRRTSV